MCESGSPERRAPRETDCGKTGSAEPFRSRRRRCRHRRFGPYDVELPGVIESGMPRRNGQRKPGTTRGSPRRCRTAKALRISRRTAKSQCAHGWGGWGRLSDDDPRQHNLEPSEGPWGEVYPTSMAAHDSSGRPDTERDYRTPSRCAKGRHKLHTSQRMPGAGLSWRVCGKVLPYMPALQPYRGKPAVRNDRGGRGNVGIIRSPVRASILPDCGGRGVILVPCTATQGTAGLAGLRVADSFHPVSAWINQEGTVVTHMVDVPNARRTIVRPSVRHACFPKCIYCRSIGRFETPMPRWSVIWLATDLDQQVKPVWMVPIAPLAV
jgi:hypothetical protein